MTKPVVQKNVKGNRKKEEKIKSKNNKIAISTYLSIITLNIHELNIQIKRHNMGE